MILINLCVRIGMYEYALTKQDLSPQAGGDGGALACLRTVHPGAAVHALSRASDGRQAGRRHRPEYTS